MAIEPTVFEVMADAPEYNTSIAYVGGDSTHRIRTSNPSDINLTCFRHDVNKKAFRKWVNRHARRQARAQLRQGNFDYIFASPYLY